MTGTTIAVLIAAYLVILGVVALMTRWQVFSDCQPRRKQRVAVVPPVGGIERHGGGAG